MNRLSSLPKRIISSSSSFRSYRVLRSPRFHGEFPDPREYDFIVNVDGSVGKEDKVLGTGVLVREAKFGEKISRLSLERSGLPQELVGNSTYSELKAIVDGVGEAKEIGDGSSKIILLGDSETVMDNLRLLSKGNRLDSNTSFLDLYMDIHTACSSPGLSDTLSLAWISRAYNQCAHYLSVAARKKPSDFEQSMFEDVLVREYYRFFRLDLGKFVVDVDCSKKILFCQDIWGIATEFSIVFHDSDHLLVIVSQLGQQGLLVHVCKKKKSGRSRDLIDVVGLQRNQKLEVMIYKCASRLFEGLRDAGSFESESLVLSLGLVDLSEDTVHSVVRVVLENWIR